MKNYLLTAVISITSLFGQTCQAQTKLPKELPKDFQITLTEQVTVRRSIYIGNNELIVSTGSGIHNHKTEKFTISHEDIEKIYAVLLENKIDQIKQIPKTDWGDEPKSEYKIEIRYNTNYLWLNSNPPKLLGDDQKRFETVRQAVLDLAKLKEKK
jgi:hypothetical protein